MINLKTLLTVLLVVPFLFACDTNKTTQLEREAQYAQEGDTIKATQGKGEGEPGKRFVNP
jgi:hypothetical protein